MKVTKASFVRKMVLARISQSRQNRLFAIWTIAATFLTSLFKWYIVYVDKLIIS